jgi:hypothetical protein
LQDKNEKQEELIKEAAIARMEKLSIDIKTKHGIDCSTNIRSGKIYKLIKEVEQLQEEFDSELTEIKEAMAEEGLLGT